MHGCEGLGSFSRRAKGRTCRCRSTASPSPAEGKSCSHRRLKLGPADAVDGRPFDDVLTPAAAAEEEEEEEDEEEEEEEEEEEDAAAGAPPSVAAAVRATWAACAAFMRSRALSKVSGRLSCSMSASAWPREYSRS